MFGDFRSPGGGGGGGVVVVVSWKFRGGGVVVVQGGVSGPPALLHIQRHSMAPRQHHHAVPSVWTIPTRTQPRTSIAIGAHSLAQLYYYRCNRTEETVQAAQKHTTRTVDEFLSVEVVHGQRDLARPLQPPFQLHVVGCCCCCGCSCCCCSSAAAGAALLARLSCLRLGCCCHHHASAAATRTLVVAAAATTKRLLLLLVRLSRPRICCWRCYLCAYRPRALVVQVLEASRADRLPCSCTTATVPKATFLLLLLLLLPLLLLMLMLMLMLLLLLCCAVLR
jgi:hypothetical protein